LKQNNIYLLLVLVIIISLFAASSCSKQKDELEGSWVLTYDPDSPDSPPDDILVFKGNNKVDIRDSKSLNFSCNYKKEAKKVTLICNIKGNIKTLDMEFSADNPNVLINPSGAEYTKQ
jgi:hypothetical protein